MPHRLNSYLAGNSAISEIMQHAEKIAVLDHIYRAALPESLALYSYVIGMERQNLIVGAENGAIAAKIRHMAPQILLRVQESNAQVTGILVKVQVKPTPAPGAQASSRHTLSQEGERHLAEFSSTLTKSPLKSAIQRLIRSKSR